SVCTCFCPCIALARCTLLPYTTLFRSKEAEVEGKIWVVKNNDPHTDPDLFKGKTRLYYGRYDYKYEKAREMGALGVLIVHTTPSDRKSTRLNSSHVSISYAVFCLKKKK